MDVPVGISKKPQLETCYRNDGKDNTEIDKANSMRQNKSHQRNHSFQLLLLRQETGKMTLIPPSATSTVLRRNHLAINFRLIRPPNKFQVTRIPLYDFLRQTMPAFEILLPKNRIKKKGLVAIKLLVARGKLGNVCQIKKTNDRFINLVKIFPIFHL